MGPSAVARRQEPPARSALGSSQLSAIASDSSVGSAHSSVSRRGGRRVRLGPGSVASAGSSSARPLGSAARGCIKLIDNWRAWLEDSLGPGRSSIAAFCFGLLGVLVVVWATWRILGAVLDLWPVWLALAVLTLATVGLSGGARNFTFRAAIAAAGLAFVCLRRRGHEIAAVAGALAAAVLPPPVLAWASRDADPGHWHLKSLQADLERRRSAHGSRSLSARSPTLSDLPEATGGEEESDDDTAAYLRLNPHAQAPGEVLADRRVLDTPPYRSVPPVTAPRSTQSELPVGAGRRRAVHHLSRPGPEHVLEDSELALEELQGELVHPHQLAHHQFRRLQPQAKEQAQLRRDRPPLSELGSPVRAQRPPPGRPQLVPREGQALAAPRTRSAQPSAPSSGANAADSHRSDGRPTPAPQARRRWGWLARVFRRQSRGDQPPSEHDSPSDRRAPRLRDKPRDPGNSFSSNSPRGPPSEPPSVARTAPVESWGGAYRGEAAGRGGAVPGSPNARRVSFSAQRRAAPPEAQSALVPRRIPFDRAPRPRSEFEAALVEEEFGIAPEDEFGDGVTGSVGTYSVD